MITYVIILFFTAAIFGVVAVLIYKRNTTADTVGTSQGAHIGYAPSMLCQRDLTANNEYNLAQWIARGLPYILIDGEYNL